ncbi:MAG: hypothetical protein AAB368_11150, partial [bacterium]
MTAALALLLAAASGAADRPSEDSLFGGTAVSATTASESAPAPKAVSAPDNPLTIGGQLYWRAQFSALDRGRAERWPLAAPAVVDGYLDGRPNDRVRVQIVPRLFYDPTAESRPPPSAAAPAAPPANPRVVLDQLWTSFDVARAVFVTAGRQHLKWGAGRFWNPTDFLHQAKRDPLAQFDVRTGTTMLKLHAPWEKAGANAYALAVLDGARAVSAPERVGGAGRIEAACGPSEIGLDAFGQRGSRTRLGADLSAGVGDVDVYLEGAATDSTDGVRWRKAAAPVPGDYASRFEPYRPAGWQPAVTGGLEWSRKMGDQDLLTLAAEGFWQRAGYASGT